MLRIPDLDFCPSRIPDQKTATKERGKKNLFSNLYNHRYHKIKNYFNFELVKKKMCANLQRIIELSTQKIVIRFSKIWVSDPRSGKKLIPDLGVKRHRIPDPDPQHLIFKYGYASQSLCLSQKFRFRLCLMFVFDKKSGFRMD